MARAGIQSNFAKAVVLILTAIFLFDIMGAIIKHLGDRYPPQQLSVFRNLFGLVPSVLVLWYSKAWHEAGRPLVIERWLLALGRGLFVTGAQFCFYLALTKMAFATASTLVFAGPLFVTALSVPLLGKPVGIVRWLAVLAGFAGVLLVMQPGGEVFNWYAILPVFAAFGYACNNITAQLFRQETTTAAINLYSIVGALAGSAVLLWLTTDFVPVVGIVDWLWLLALGTAGGMAVFCLISAYRLTEPSSLSPFEYFGIPFSFLIGWIVFSEAPFDQLFPGVLLIVGGGLAVIWRERRRL
ncbi:MAG: DMT family transporter [Rhizobiaceae bacterium]